MPVGRFRGESRADVGMEGSPALWGEPALADELAETGTDDGAGDVPGDKVFEGCGRPAFQSRVIR